MLHVRNNYRSDLTTFWEYALESFTRQFLTGRHTAEHETSSLGVMLLGGGTCSSLAVANSEYVNMLSMNTTYAQKHLTLPPPPPLPPDLYCTGVCCKFLKSDIHVLRIASLRAMAVALAWINTRRRWGES